MAYKDVKVYDSHPRMTRVHMYDRDWEAIVCCGVKCVLTRCQVTICTVKQGEFITRKWDEVTCKNCKGVKG